MAGVPAIRFEAVVKGMRLLEVIVVGMVLTWSLHYRGGLALASDNKDLIFNVCYSLPFLNSYYLSINTQEWGWRLRVNAKRGQTLEIVFHSLNFVIV